MSDEEIRVRAVEAVREHLEISDATRQSTSLKTAWAIISAVIGATAIATWIVAGFLHANQMSLDRIEGQLEWKIPEQQLVSWANALDHLNRNVQQKDGVTGLNVPDPSSYRPVSANQPK